MSSNGGKDATAATRAANASVLRELPFEERDDFDAATRGRVAQLTDGGKVAGRNGAPPMWDLSRYDFATGEAPDTVNPSLWRQLEIMREGGLFEVAEGIYLVVGQDPLERRVHRDRRRRGHDRRPDVAGDDAGRAGPLLRAPPAQADHRGHHHPQPQRC